MVEDRLSEFGMLLRQNGLRVSPGELADAAGALGLLGLEDRATTHAALRSTLVKRGRDAPVFDRLFDLYFGGLGRLLEGLETGLLDQLAEEGFFSPDSIAMLAHELAHRPLSPLARAALEGDVPGLARLLRGAALQVDLGGIQNQFQEGFYARRLGSAAGVGGLAGELKALEDDLRARGLDPSALELVSRRLAQALRRLEGAVQRLVKQELEGREIAKNRRTTRLSERNFALLTPEEIGRMETAVRRLAERLKARLARRQRSRRRGALSVRRTLRKNLLLGGIPMRPVFRQKKALRPDVLVLCDVSDSVRNVSRLMLLFVYTLQSLFGRVRSFAFVSDLGELTDHFRGKDASEAVDQALSGKAVSLFANSNYGRALSLFTKDFLGAVTRRTTVIIIGDGRNNHNPANGWALREIKLKAKRLVWICPESRSSWGLGDSEMLLYAKECSTVAVVTNLSELEGIGEELVPR
jgi:uncharacterized protein with von Willebrand factor type A (vWA) domain